MRNYIYMLLLLLTTIVFIACNESALIEEFKVEPPVITEFSPKSGDVGTEITIIGENLDRIDQVQIGGGNTSIKYRISSTKLVAKVLTSSRSGVISVANSAGEAQSSDHFTISYATPSIDAYPTEGKIGADIVIYGDNLNTIDAVLLGTDEASIISKMSDEIVFKVPYSNAQGPVELSFIYFDGTQNSKIGPSGNTFSIISELPRVFEFPASLTKYTPVEIKGDKLSLIDSIFIGNAKVMILSKTDTSIIFDMYPNYFGGSMASATLKGVYYGEEEIIITDAFSLITDPNEPRYYKHTDVLLSARSGYGGTEDAFFDAETGAVYNSCSAFENRTGIDFFLYDQSGYVQLYGPHNATNTVKNFKCNNVTIDPQDGSWNDFYGAGGIETRFKALNRANPDELRVIEAYEAGTIIELNSELFSGIELPTTSAPRVYKSSSNAGFSASSGHFSLDEYSIGWVRNFTTGKNGIIKLKEMPKDAVNGRIPELIFDIIWAK